MSNVRTFRDLPQPQGNRMQQGLLGNFPDCPMIMPRSYNVNPDPRKETYWDMLKFACCPLFTVKSFIFVISIIQIIYYIVALSIGMKNDEFLTPSYKSLDDLGAKVNSKLEDGEVWRWVLPMLLHANLAHIGSNLLSQFILGFRLEPTILVARMAILYVLSGIGGTLFSALVSDTLSVGASTAISGIVAAMLVYLFINWKALEPFQNARAMTLCWLIIMLLFNVVYGASDDNIDNYGHLGGFVTGGLVAMFLVQRLGPESKNDKIIKYLGISGFTIYFVLGFVGFYMF